MRNRYLTIAAALLTIICPNGILAQTNPMGKTWVVFIENSTYVTLPVLDGPPKDAVIIKNALANYKIDMFIHKKNMTKKEMEQFFSIQLPDLLKTNQIKSLLLWYAGIGGSVDNQGYWIPVDAKIDDESTYLNLNSLITSLQSYTTIIHLLVINDASKAGPSLMRATRSATNEPRCDDVNVYTSKSAQILSSAGHENVPDNSQFTQSFANSLINNNKQCISIESVAKDVIVSLSNSNQRPRFGKLVGLTDEDGSFIFIKK